MEIEFKRITDFPRGTLATLLKDGYSFEPNLNVIGMINGKSLMIFFMIIPILLIFSGFMTVLEGNLSGLFPGTRPT